MGFAKEFDPSSELAVAFGFSELKRQVEKLLLIEGNVSKGAG